MPQIVLVLDEVVGECVEQFGIAGGVRRAHVVDRLDQPAAHQVAPEAIDEVPRDQLTATTDPAAAIKQSDVSFVIVPTPSNTLGGFSNQSTLAEADLADLKRE